MQHILLVRYSFLSIHYRGASPTDLRWSKRNIFDLRSLPCHHEPSTPGKRWQREENQQGRAQMGAEWGLSWFIPGFSIPFSNWNWIKTMNPGIHDNLIICECEPDKIIIPAVGVEKNQLDRCFDKLFVEHNPLTDFYTYMQYIDDRIMSPS